MIRTSLSFASLIRLGEARRSSSEIRLKPDGATYRDAGVRGSRRTGLTLIELMASLTLLSILMAVLSGLIPTFAGKISDRATLRTAHQREWMSSALAVVERDLLNADSIIIAENRLECLGRLARDPETGRLNDRIGACTYVAEPLGNRTMIIRQESGRRELLLTANTSLILESLSEQGTPSAQYRVDRRFKSNGLQVVVNRTSRMRLTLIDDDGLPLISRLLVLEPGVTRSSGSGGVM